MLIAAEGVVYDGPRVTILPSWELLPGTAVDPVDGIGGVGDHGERAVAMPNVEGHLESPHLARGTDLGSRHFGMDHRFLGYFVRCGGGFYDYATCPYGSEVQVGVWLPASSAHSYPLSFP